MPTHQQKTGLAIVVKRPVAPASCVVALLTLCAQAPLVFVVLFVTGVAFNRSILECRLRMAILALDLDVLAQQRERDETMIETGACPPGLVVTLLALIALLAFVHVICSMTGDAPGLQFLLVKISGMAGFTGDGLVFTAQRITR